MTPLFKNFSIASTMVFLACGGRASDGTSQPAAANGAPASTAESGTAKTTNEELPRASFCDPSRGGDVTGALFEALSPEPSADYLAMRRNTGTIPSPGLTKDLVTVKERGELCKGASDIAKCKQDYAALSPPIRVGEHYCFTRGDEVGCLETKAQAMAFLEEVHSLEEAFFVAQYDGYYAQCTYPQVIARGKELADGSFRLDLMKGGGCSDIFRAVITVARDGTLTELAATKSDLELGCP